MFAEIMKCVDLQKQICFSVVRICSGNMTHTFYEFLLFCKSDCFSKQNVKNGLS
jgi:hypothetical protein